MSSWEHHYCTQSLPWIQPAFNPTRALLALSARASIIADPLLSSNSTTSEQLQLADLPPELLSQIAAHHSGPDLTSFANASTLLRDVSCPLRYEQITLGWAIGVDEEGEIDMDGFLQLKKTVREMLEDLAADSRKLACVRTLRILEYSWYGEREWELMAQAVGRATVLETVQMVSPFSCSAPLSLSG